MKVPDEVYFLYDRIGSHDKVDIYPFGNNSVSYTNKCNLLNLV